MTQRLRVSEIFYSIQGEGITMGVPAVFLRLQYCNLLCQWCDTVDVWKRGRVMSDDEIIAWIKDRGLVPHIRSRNVHLVCTGGEPLLYREALTGFVNTLADTIGGLPYIEVETNGTRHPHELFYLVSQFNISPKLSNSAMPREKRLRAPILRVFATHPQAYFKFVVTSMRDWDEIVRDFIEGVPLDRSRVILMPEAMTREELERKREWVIELCKVHGVRYSDRLHISTWNTATGV